MGRQPSGATWIAWWCGSGCKAGRDLRLPCEVTAPGERCRHNWAQHRVRPCRGRGECAVRCSEKDAFRRAAWKKAAHGHVAPGHLFSLLRLMSRVFKDLPSGFSLYLMRAHHASMISCTLAYCSTGLCINDHGPLLTSHPRLICPSSCINHHMSIMLHPTSCGCSLTLIITGGCPSFRFWR